MNKGATLGRWLERFGVCMRSMREEKKFYTSEATEYSDGSCYFYVEWDLNVVGKLAI